MTTPAPAAMRRNSKGNVSAEVALGEVEEPPPGSKQESMPASPPPQATPPMVRAARDKDGTTVMALIEESGRPCLPCEMRDSKHKATPIAWAAYNNDLSTLISLIKAGADLEAGNRHGCTAMNLASGMGHTECLRELIAANANPNSVNSFGHSPFTLSAAFAKPESMALLIEAGADRYHRENKGRDGVELAKTDDPKKDEDDPNRKENVAKVLELMAEADGYGKEQMKPLTAAIKKGDLVTISAQLDAPRGKLLLQQRDAYGNTPLVLAAWQGNAAVIEMLVERRALLDLRNSQGSTPLATAAHYGHEDACRALLAAGADMSLMDKKDRTPLDVAKERNKEACIALLENPPPPVGKNPAIAIAALEESLKEVILD